MLTEFQNHLYARGYSLRTITAYVYEIRSFYNVCEKLGEEPCPENIQPYMAYLVEKSNISRAYLAQIRAAFVVFLRCHRWEEDEISAYLPPVLPVRQQRTIPTPFEVQKIFCHAMSSPMFYMLQLTYGSGLRLSEALNMTWRDIDFNNYTAKVRHGKGDKMRIVPVSKSLCESAYNRAQRGQRDMYVCAYDSHSRLTARRAQEEFQYIRESLELDEAITIHSLRHAFATKMLQNGVDLVALKEILGHSHISTTEIYLHCEPNYEHYIKSALDF